MRGVLQVLVVAGQPPTLSVGLDPLIAGAFLIVGTLLGGFISFLTARWLDSRARQREERLRWVRDVRDAGARLIAYSHDYEEAALLIHKSYLRGEDPNIAAGPVEPWDQLVEAQRGLARATSLISLIAPDDVAAAAHEVLARATELGRASGHLSGTDFDEIQYSYSEAFAEFILTARERLEVNVPLTA